jgi:hypothetical protein
MTNNLHLHATSRLTAATDGAHVREAIDSVTWERRGLLQRLVRTSSRDDEAKVRRRGR